jgi:homoserine dehydrogenase
MRVDLAFAGFGHVGQRFARLLHEKRDELRRDFDLEPRIVGIATRRRGVTFSAAGLDIAPLLDAESGVPAPADAAGSTPADTLGMIRLLGRSGAPLRVLAEVTTLDIEHGQPAIAHVEAALDARCHVITANKGPASFAYHRLAARAAEAGASFLFEGAVMDGVPVFSLVRETLPAVRISGFRGIVNSTTNFILAALEEGQDFDAALAAMQADGIAEADASLDVDGWDAAAKAAVLANVLLDARLTPRLVDRAGIDRAAGARARAARMAGRRLKLVASARRTSDGAVTASVRPTELESDDVLAGVSGRANALVLETDLLGSIAIHQLGGDLTMTAYALLSDLIAVREGRITSRRTAGSPRPETRADPLP